MKKWIFIIIIILILVVWRAISIYQSAFEPVKQAEEKATQIALENTDLQSIENTYSYYGTNAYQVILGKNQDDEEIIVWVPENKGDVVLRKVSEGITEEEALHILSKERNPKEIRSIKLGIEDHLPIWEIIYIGEDNRLTYYKLYFETGKYRNSIKP
ncbi:DUF5590 domain-containing protein [Ferdinandcohnia quinoae]|uniref:DUF5590 domain-containing protein n=1 Tax=Fredinandcohnia quinoae TaxID=2918902 RepID=A0AAW5DWJ5_9BACI|nr:DUF5590 domain-containing protein [Fredinandcohnia sp. SECRCQ15]MCH1624713.1 DUF5590 domain-containing protein [Fredinandcohnia sp. SECRCQ15]